ncbi:MAG: SurA N-terminal domain-containing protein [Elusimicrobia bacterium]|nr:SurA N-terminal domain-containing protein [Elusimicrobiota bacterium]
MILSTLRRHRRSLFIGVVAIFLIGIFVGLGGYLFTSRDMSEAVAVVGSTKISYMRFQSRLNSYLDAARTQGKELSDAQTSEIKGAMLRDMIVDEILYQEAQKMGIEVTDLELNAAIRNNASFQSGGQFSQMQYFQAVRQSLRMTPEDYEREQRKAMMASKLKQQIFQCAKTLPAEVPDEYQRQKGSMKGFEKERAAFAQELERTRALDLINFYLRGVTAGMDIRQFLQEREQGR